MPRTPTPDGPHARSRVNPVVPLATYRAARHAANVLLGLLHEPPWLAGIAVEMQDGTPVIVVRVHTLDERQTMTPFTMRAGPLRGVESCQTQSKQP